MPVYQTNKLIDDLQQQTESFLQKAVSEWQMLPAKKLLAQPAADKWSAAQCLEHLNSYGNYYLPEIEKAIKTARQNNGTAKEQFKAGWLGDYFTNMMKPDTVGRKMKKMKAPKNHTPISNLDSDKVLSTFIDQQERLLKLLEESRKININTAKVPISIAKFIKLKLGDVFMFLITHNYRHILQAERAMEVAMHASANQVEVKTELNFS